jgi:protein-disulfide isomerase
MQKFGKRKEMNKIQGSLYNTFFPMKKLLFVSLVAMLFLSACTTPANDTPATVSGESVMIDAPTYGSGKHVLEYYGDYQCPACINFMKTIFPVFEEFAASGQLTIVYKQFPLTTIHKNAYRDAIAALCAAEQGEYMSYKKALYALEDAKNGASVSDSDRVNLAKEISAINSDTFAQCLKSDKYASSVDRDIADGDKKRVNATPTVFLDGLKLDM